MAEHSALMVVTPAAARSQASGASLRVDDVRDVLADAGYAVKVVARPDLARVRGRFCLGVAVSYATAGAVRRLRAASGRVWLDATDSWLLLDFSGIRAGQPAYALRALRDGVRLAAMPTPDLVTWISADDLKSDRGTVRGNMRCVLPGSLPATAMEPVPSESRRVVLVGDWRYPPNRDGLLWFSRSVLPKLAVSVDVFGQGLDGVALPSQLVSHGYAPDTAALYRQGDVHVAPIRFGAGVKRKVLQPLLAGLPVVTTTAGAHGLRRHHLVDVCHTADEFASAIAARLAGSLTPPRPPSPSEVLEGDDTQRVQAWLRRCPAHE